VIEFHSVPCTARAELQDIELAWISQEVTERFYTCIQSDVRFGSCVDGAAVARTF
jgi:hypothetical protein